MHFEDTRTQVTVRPLQPSDDRLQVAKLIYLSDEYIYPNWFDSIEDGQRVIAAMMSLPTLYNEKNITVAVTEEGFVAAAMVSCYMPIELREEDIRAAFTLAKVPVDERTHKIFLDYYNKMDGERGRYFANLATDPEYRGRGIGSALLSSALRDGEFSYLECVQANEGAWRIYQRLGFRIVEEYPGVFDVPCYKMERGE